MLRQLQLLLDALPPLEEKDQALEVSSKDRSPVWQEIGKDINFIYDLKIEKDENRPTTVESFIYEMQVQGIPREETLKIFNWPQITVFPTIMRVVKSIYASYKEYSPTTREVLADNFFPCLVYVLSHLEKQNLMKLFILAAQLEKTQSLTEVGYYMATVQAAVKVAKEEKTEPLDVKLKEILDKKLSVSEPLLKIESNFNQPLFLQKMRLVFQHMVDPKQRTCLPLLMELEQLHLEVMRKLLSNYIKQKLPTELCAKIFPNKKDRILTMEDLSKDLETVDNLELKQEVLTEAKKNPELKGALDNYTLVRNLQKIITNSNNTPLERLQEAKQFYLKMKLNPLHDPAFNLLEKHFKVFMQERVLAKTTKVAALLATKFDKKKATPLEKKTELSGEKKKITP